MQASLKGVITAILTPFGPQEELDEAALRAHIEFQIDSSVHGLLFTGGCGEFLNLDDDERCRVMHIAVDQVRGRVPVIVGILAPDTRHVCQLARYAGKVGADAIMVLPPYYVTPSPDAVSDHYRRVADATEVPIVVYNNPGRTNVHLQTSMLMRLAEIEQVVAVKDCDRNLTSLSEKIREGQGRLEILSGEDDLAYATLMLGSKGGVWATANLFPETFVAMYQAVVTGDVTAARECQFRLLRFCNACFTPNHPAPLKAAMAMAGRPLGRARSPLSALSDEQVQSVRAALNSMETQRLYTSPSQGL